MFRCDQHDFALLIFHHCLMHRVNCCTEQTIHLLQHKWFHLLVKKFCTLPYIHCKILLKVLGSPCSTTLLYADSYLC